MVLEESDMAEKMTLISPATIPETPDSPNRLALVLVGLVLALGGGVGFGSMMEFMDSTVHTREDVARISTFPVLGGIPYLVTRKERHHARRRRFGFAVGLVLTVLLTAVSVHLFIQPFDPFFSLIGFAE
jgi:polysaccharide biosynthesis transport protein